MPLHSLYSFISTSPIKKIILILFLSQKNFFMHFTDFFGSQNFKNQIRIFVAKPTPFLSVYYLKCALCSEDAEAEIPIHSLSFHQVGDLNW